MDAIMIVRQQPDSWNGIPRTVAVATTEKAAMQWIQDEVDGKHDSSHSYMQGKSAEYWVKDYPLFRLIPGKVQEESSSNKSDLTAKQKNLTTKMFIGAITPLTDALGHFPDCGYTDEKPDCPCFEAGNRIHQAIIDVVVLTSQKKHG